MACSKLFSGDLPEVSTYIIQCLRNDFNTLYSLALVNRFWCQLAIPLIWEDPFSIEYQEKTLHFLDIYFLFLNDNDKIKLKENLKFCNFDQTSQKPSFNYPSLIKTLHLGRIQIHVIDWFNSFNSISCSSKCLSQRSSNKEPYFPLTSLSYCRKICVECERLIYEKAKDIFVGLLKLFVENNASLNHLHVNDYISYQLFCDVINIISNNPTFVSEIEGFYFNYIGRDNHPQQLRLSPSLFTSVKHIDISTYEFEFFFTNLIQSQSQLSSITTSLISGHLLNSLKYSSNTLVSINFSSCNCSNITGFGALSHLTQLESLQFNNCYGIITGVIQPLLNITTPLKIKTFVIVDNVDSDIASEVVSIQLLIQKIGSYLENLVLNIYEDDSRRQLFDTVIDICGKIKFLHLDPIDFMNIPQLSKMIYTFNNHLKYLTLRYKVDFDDEDDNSSNLLCSMILKELSKSLSLPLYYLDLELIINPNDLKVFLENIKQVGLKKLLIRNWSNDNLDTTLNVIKDFVKEKNLEFLAYGIGSCLLPEEDKRHESLEKLVEETQSFVQMKSYKDLVVKVSDIDGNLIIN